VRAWIQKLVLPVTLVIAALLSNAQEPQPPDLKNFEEIARDGKIMYLVNTKDAVKHNGRFQTVELLGAHYKLEADGVKYALNNIAYIVSVFRIDCTAGTGARLHDQGKWPKKDGTIETINATFPNAKMEKPDKSRKLFLAIDVVCGGVTDGKVPYKWTGGNGCNLIGGGEKEKRCCVDHDYIYRSGGGMRMKWQADSELYKCVSKNNKLPAPFTFVGANVGGLVAFHWGKKRRIEALPAAQEDAWSYWLAEMNLESQPRWTL